MKEFTNVKLAFLSSKLAKPIKHEVQGTELEFYPMSGKAAAGLRLMAPKIGQAVEVFTSDRSKDTSQSTSSYTSVSDGTTTEDSQNEAASLDTLKWRTEQRQSAIQELVDCLFSSDMREALFNLIASCLRIGPDNRPTPEEFFDEVTVEALAETIVGCVKANKKVLGPFSELLSKKLKGAIGSVVRQVEQPPVQEETPGETSGPNTSTVSERDMT